MFFQAEENVNRTLFGTDTPTNPESTNVRQRSSTDLAFERKLLEEATSQEAYSDPSKRPKLICMDSQYEKWTMVYPFPKRCHLFANEPDEPLSSWQPGGKNSNKPVRVP